MKTRGAILREVPGRFEVVELDLEDPRPGELLVRVAASGMCHSDDHVATGDLPSEIELYTAGRLKLDEIITTRYSLDQVNEGYADMHAGRNVRGVITFDTAA